MANWARGLASGLETGVRIGDLLEQRRQREELAKAYGLAPQEQQAPLATPEQIGRAQAETQALAAQDAEMFGLAPQEMQRYAPAMPQEGARTGMSTYRLGEQVLQRAPTQAEIDMARMRAAADVYGRFGDAARREELMRGLRAEQRAQTAEERAAQQFETQQRTAGLTQQQLQQQIAAGGRAAAAAERMDAFTQWAQQNPDQSRDFAAVSAKARELRMTPDEQFKVASNLTGIDEAEFKASQSRIRKLVANQGLDGLLKAHRESNDLDPGSHFEQVRGKDGTITLNRVDTATGRIIQPNVFSGKEAEVVGYLNKAAMDPATIVDYTMNLRKTQAAIEAQEASAAANRATTQLRGLQGRAITDQTAATAEAARIRAEYEALTPEEQAGAKGQGLIRQFNMANVKAGATVPLGAAGRPEFSPKDYAATIKSFTDAGFSQADATIRADQLYGRAPADTKVDENLRKQNETKATGAAAPRQRGPGDLSTVDIQKIRSEAAILDAAIAQAQTIASAAVRSGDVNAIKLYGDKLNALRAQREALTAGLTGPALQSVGLSR